ncbi:MAG: FAD-dependent oxidoreductase [Bacteroidales bacterium]|nr:FAD-dependent oxidoreductase [Bacteroidales bacterium]
MKEFEQTFDILHTPSEEELLKAASVACGVPASKVRQCVVLRRSLDARSRPVYRYRLRAFLAGDDAPKEYVFDYKDVRSAPEVIVIGGGPAGTFASLKLLEKGLKPVILERGKDVHGRKVDISAIVREGVVNADSNYCFGEGGAGTFSDGKLYTRSSKRGDIQEVLRQLVAFGAQESILTDAHPHIGSDVLPRVMESIRNCITSHGGEYHFGSKVVDLTPPSSKDGKWKVLCADGCSYTASAVILATGHSARDIYELFAAKVWALKAKGFALGVRVEHPQHLIDEIQYHKRWQPGYPHAEYALVEQVEGRGVFSFCMCPGGVLVPSTTESNAVVLNGMSPSTRSGKKANAGIVCSVEPQDVAGFEKYGPLALLEFQKSVEQRMYDNSSSFRAPAQRMTDFCRGRLSASLPACSYAPGTDSAALTELLPDFVASRLRKAFPLFDRKMHGFYTQEALVLGVESRTSSPVRIPRDENTLCHITLDGLYPCGEGAGYAGGIVSSALDGIAVANAICSRSLL